MIPSPPSEFIYGPPIPSPDLPIAKPLSPISYSSFTTMSNNPNSYVSQAPRKGPGRPPKKRGPGRPPKKRPEDMPDYCPEFLDPSLFVDINNPTNQPKVDRVELVYHFLHIEPYHTSPMNDASIIDIPRTEDEKIRKKRVSRLIIFFFKLISNKVWNRKLHW